MIKIDEDALKRINRNFAALDKLFAKDALNRLTDAVYEKAVEYADEHTKTGEMIKAMFYRKQKSSAVIGIDKEKAPYAWFVHYGTKPHLIKFRDKKALRWAKNGAFIFAKKVNHPGYKGDRFLIRALNEESEKFALWLDKEIKSRVR